MNTVIGIGAVAGGLIAFALADAPNIRERIRRFRNR